MKPFLIVLALLAAAGAGYAIYLETKPPEAAFIVACERELMQRLKAPATYKRVETVLVIEKASAEEALGTVSDFASHNEEYMETRAMMRRLYEPHPPYRHKLFITYDAANSYGTPIRGIATCEAFKTSPEPLTERDLVITSSLHINGQTNTERLLEATKALIGQ